MRTALVALTLLAVQPALAAGGGLSTSLLDEQGKLGWSGEVETFFNANRDTIPSRSSPQDAEVYAHLRPRLDLKNEMSLRTDFLFRADSGNSKRNTVRVDEAYLSAKIPGTRVTVRGGKIIYHWGQDLVFNPTDLLNPYDFYDFFHIDKLGVPAVDATLEVNDKVTVDAGVIPIFQPSIVSDPYSRWINYSTFVSSAVVSKLALPANLPPGYTVPFDLDQRSPKYPQAFARVAYRGLSIEGALTYTYRYNPVPQVVLFSSAVGYDPINGVPTGSIVGEPYYQHEHVFALDAAKPLWGAVFYAGSVLTLPDGTQSDIPSSSQISSNYNNVGLGANVTSADISAASKSSSLIATFGVRRDWSRLHAYLQYARIWYLRGAAPAAMLGKLTNGVGVNPTDVFDFFSGTLLPGFTWDFVKKVSFRAGLIVNLKNNGLVGEGGFEYAFADGFKTSLLYDYIDGKGGSLLSYYSGNSRLSLNMSMAF